MMLLFVYLIIISVFGIAWGLCEKWWSKDAAAIKPMPFEPAVVVPGETEDAPGRVWRGRQPVGDEWKVLWNLGIRTVLKLNYDDEAVDRGAILAGLEVIECSMPPKDFIGAFGKPDPVDVARAVGIVAYEIKWPIYVHCQHGQDRTGLVIGEYRVLQQGWSAQDAWNEMIKYGFHPELPDLMATWLDFVYHVGGEQSGDHK